MKFLIILSLIALAACKETYTTEFDNIDIEAIVGNNESLKTFYECFVDKGDCDAAGKDFKKDLPEVFTQACAKCTAAQKHLMKRFLEELKKKLPTEFEDFKKKYDPKGEYYSNLEKAVANA